MGNFASTPMQLRDSVTNMLTGHRKRRRSTDAANRNGEEQNEEGQAPKKKRLLTTTQYIYNALFKEQKNSDIKVIALGKIWYLHKIYLCQSPYFNAMFNGSWLESQQDTVNFAVEDPRITVDSLDAVFGSLYSDEIAIEPSAVLSVLATATVLQMDPIIEKCAEVMCEHIKPETIIEYYEAACQYGCMNVKNATLKWLEINLLCIYLIYPNILRNIGAHLMTKLVSSPDLYVMQTEFSLYSLLRMWMYLKLHPSFNPEDSEQVQERLKAQKEQLERQKKLAGNKAANIIDDEPNNDPAIEVARLYFTNRKSDTSFLTTNEGQQFFEPFRALRTQFLINHYVDLKIVLSDNIIPKDWLNQHVLSHWQETIRADHSSQIGPKNLEPEVFYKHCMRCGRILHEPGYQKWRWTGFNFGIDLVLIADSRSLSIRRHHRNEHERLLSLQTKRQFMIRVSITSINENRQPVFTQTSEVLSLSLEKNEELTLMTMDTKLKHPLMISVNLLVVSPTSQAFKDCIPVNDEANQSIPISEIGGADSQLSINNREAHSTEALDSSSDSAIFSQSSSSQQGTTRRLNPPFFVNLIDYTFPRSSSSASSSSSTYGGADTV